MNLNLLRTHETMPPPETMHTQQKIFESGPELEFHMENLDIRAETSEFREKILEIATNVATLAFVWSRLSPSRARDPPSNVTSQRPVDNKGEHCSWRSTRQGWGVLPAAGHHLRSATDQMRTTTEKLRLTVDVCSRHLHHEPTGVS